MLRAEACKQAAVSSDACFHLPSMLDACCQAPREPSAPLASTAEAGIRRGNFRPRRKHSLLCGPDRMWTWRFITCSSVAVPEDAEDSISQEWELLSSAASGLHHSLLFPQGLDAFAAFATGTAGPCQLTTICWAKLMARLGSSQSGVAWNIMQWL